MKITKKLFLLALISFTFVESVNAAALVTIAVSTDSRSLQDVNGVALTGGSSNVSGDGTAVQIGYYQGATPNTIFFGGGDETTFVPLIGAGSVLGLNLTVGDTALNFAGNGEIFADIDITGTHAAFPAVGVPLVMRFFTSTSLTGLGSRFEAISNLSWRWVNPVDLPSIARVDMNFDISGMVSKSGANIANSGAAIRASSPNPLAVPEPTTVLLITLAGAMMCFRRNR